MKTWIRFGFLFLATASAMSLSAADSGGAAPATITKEGDLVILKLTEEAESALRLKVVPVEKRVVGEVRLFSGEVVIPLSSEGRAVAPFLTGTLDEVLKLADQQAAADGRVLQAEARSEAAKTAMHRAEKMLSAEAGSVRTVDEARAALAVAEADLVTARKQRDLLGVPASQTGTAKTWVRASIFSGEAPLLDEAATVGIRALGSRTEAIDAKPVKGPPTANAATGNLDWYFELPQGAAFRAGERVEVEIPTTEGSREALVVPFAAVVHDINGGQWVYRQSAPHTYTRHRVQVARVADGVAVLASGPADGTSVVTDGVAELFGTEFMTGK